MSLKAVDGTAEKIPNIEISFAHLNQQAAFRTALGKVYKNNTLPIKTAYWLGRVHGAIVKNLEKIGEDYQKIVLEHAQKDDKGNAIPGQFPGSINLDKTKEAAFKIAKDEFEKNVMKLEFQKLNIRDFERAGLSAEELVALEPLFHGELV